MSINKFERGDFAWKDGDVIWVPDKKGKYKVHPVLGPMLENDPLLDMIIGDDLAKEIEIRLKEKLTDIKSKLK